jgi:hypothetical protein
VTSDWLIPLPTIDSELVKVKCEGDWLVEIGITVAGEVSADGGVTGVNINAFEVGFNGVSSSGVFIAD